MKYELYLILTITAVCTVGLYLLLKEASDEIGREIECREENDRE